MSINAGHQSVTVLPLRTAVIIVLQPTRFVIVLHNISDNLTTGLTPENVCMSVCVLAVPCVSMRLVWYEIRLIRMDGWLN